MVFKYFGKQFDIHCGGIDHISVHHTNEIAQSEAATGKKPWVKYWLHNEFLVLGKGEKMSKSGENFITLSTLEERGFDPLDYRYLCLGTHYRKPLMFNYEALEGAKISRRKLIDKILEIKDSNGKISKAKENNTKQKKYLNKFIKSVNDDLNTPKALAVVWELLKDEKLTDKDKYSLMIKMDSVFGLGLKEIKKEKIPDKIIKLAKERLRARHNKDWVKSDELRERICSLGYEIGDAKDGYELKKI